MDEPDLDWTVVRAIFTALPDNVLLIGIDRKIRFIGRLEVGYEGMDLIGMDALKFIAPDAREEYSALLDRVFTTLEPAEHLTAVVGADGSKEWYEAKIIPLVVDGQATSVVISSKNVTGRVRDEQELAMLRQLVPVCSWCKKIRTDDGDWRPIEAYLEEKGSGTVTHGMCPECDERMSREWGQ